MGVLTVFHKKRGNLFGLPRCEKIGSGIIS